MDELVIGDSISLMMRYMHQPMGNLWTIKGEYIGKICSGQYMFKSTL